MKPLSLFLALLLCLCLCPVAARAEGETPAPEVFTSGDYEYILLEDGTAEITWYSGSENELIIPEFINGISVTKISDHAFKVYNCSIEQITIPDSVTSMESNPFIRCENLVSFHVSPNHPTLAVIANVLFEKATKKLICYPRKKAGNNYAIPQGIQMIGDKAFYYCFDLTSVTIPDTVTSIGDFAFDNCFRLTSVSISGSVASIGDFAFDHCTSLTSVTIPDSVVSIGSNPFRWCYCLDSINVSLNHPALTVIDGILYEKGTNKLLCFPLGKTKSNYTIPQGIEAIGDSAFSGFSSLTSVSIPDSVISIGDNAFSLCTSLTSVTIPDSVTSIGNNAFENCSSLTSVTISNGITSIGSFTFYGCKKLTSITIPYGVTTIGKKAFSECDILTSIIIPDSVLAIGEEAFANYPYLTATVGRDSFAEQYCKDNGISYNYSDSLDWLNSGN